MFFVLTLLTFIAAFTFVLGGRGVFMLLCVPLLCSVISGHNKSIPAPYCGPSRRRAKFGAVEKRTRYVHYFKLYFSNSVLIKYQTAALWKLFFARLSLPARNSDTETFLWFCSPQRVLQETFFFSVLSFSFHVDFGVWMPKERPWFCDWVRCCSWSVYFHGYGTYCMKFQGRGVRYLCERHGFISLICGWVNLTASYGFPWASTGLSGPCSAGSGSYMSKNFSQLK